MTRRLIPERTVDSMFAVEVVEFVPHALVWSPTNTRGEVDHVILGLGARAISFECKGTTSDAKTDPARPWSSPIDYPQLHRYVASHLPVQYVFPAKPTRPYYPWIRTCTLDPDLTGYCTACGNAGSPSRRRWAGESQLIRSAAVHLRMQPWFAHWAWVVDAADLLTHLTSVGLPTSLPSADRQLAAIAGSERLCHFLDEFSEDHPGDRGNVVLDPADLRARLAETLFDEPPRNADTDADGQSRLTVVYLPSAPGSEEG